MKYQQLQWYLTYALIAAAGLFALYLVFAGFGIIWLKVITAILAILISAACLVVLYMRKELLRQRSLWMTVAAGAVILCLLFSLILNFPSPNKYKDLSAAVSACLTNCNL
jgi:hypothetical protein